MGKPYAKEGPSAEDKALDLFADMMIERIQSLSGKDGWKKPWFTEGALQWPKNLNTLNHHIRSEEHTSELQ